MYKCISTTLFCLLCCIATAQNITSFAGANINTFFNGAPAAGAQMSGPWGITVSPAGNIYVADRDNDGVRKINTTTGYMTTVAGCGIRDFAGDGGLATAARLRSPYCMTVDATGNIYIADAGNHCIRKVTPAGIITTYAGTGSIGYSGDNGAATRAQLNFPVGVHIDANGTLFVADAGNNVVRKITAAGIITTVAGNGLRGYSGDGGPATAATLRFPNSVTFDRKGNMYLTDSGNSCIRKVDTTGKIYTVAGTGVRGYSGDGGPA
ncbi:MAG: hypothetical protein EBZ77_16310, partial [Chitinophagia bacterium]|nr:hypothetical protein [Chitinophagia bacterium]